MMNSRERITTAFRNKEPDRVPVSDQLIVSKVAGEILGRYAYTGGGEFERDTVELLLKGERDFLVERYVEDIVELHEKLDLDFVRVQTVPPKDYQKENLPRKIEENIYLYENKETKNYTIMNFDSNKYKNVLRSFIENIVENK